MAKNKSKQSSVKTSVEVVRNREKARSIERRGNIAAWNDYVGFAVSKLVGVSGFVIGGLEYLDPNLLPITLKSPGWIAGAGLAMLTGKSLVSLIAKLEGTK